MAERVAVVRLSNRGWQVTRTALGEKAKDHEAALKRLRANVSGRTRATTNAIERHETDLAGVQEASAALHAGWDAGHDPLLDAARAISTAWTCYLDDDLVDGMATAIGNLRAVLARYENGAST